jgi:hypothetical protein
MSDLGTERLIPVKSAPPCPTCGAEVQELRVVVHPLGSPRVIFYDEPILKPCGHAIERAMYHEGYDFRKPEEDQEPHGWSWVTTGDASE